MGDGMQGLCFKRISAGRERNFRAQDNTSKSTRAVCCFFHLTLSPVDVRSNDDPGIGA